jgi:very-short-patch-repair endonuclease
VSLKQITRHLRRNQTDEEKELWRALRGRQFAGFKFRRQHTAGGHILDFYCADAKLDVELDGFQHGLPEGIQRDEAREKFLVEQGIETLRFWNHQWQKKSRRMFAGNLERAATANRLHSDNEKRRGT